MNRLIYPDEPGLLRDLRELVAQAALRSGPNQAEYVYDRALSLVAQLEPVCPNLNGPELLDLVRDARSHAGRIRVVHEYLGCSLREARHWYLRHLTTLDQP